ncbi:MAG TPA: glycosyltransferase family 39 protein, partial [Planctomycetota bacterium]|nr:glycosyltransferase family 39 protein [Planctomycetota bacterium]
MIAIPFLALAVRVWGIGFGLPLTVCRPDENLVVQPALEYFGGDFDPRFYAYGTLGSYLLHGWMRVQWMIELLSGKSADTRAFVESALVDPGHWHLVARWISATFGVVTVGLVCAIASSLRGRVAGLCSAFLLAFCFLHGRESHFGTLDVLATTLTTAAVLCALRAQDDGRWRSLLLAAACVGFAAATKYGGALAAVS